eukprot:TRINITY_DN22697_c0_g1_i1.p1 TRINITY_DN22697_c0_g1~~TRINITY_DN22697_c0_g1_i1.p1  ORF type:complete len:819 (+),score=157.87 TRINITY_DN22697_c0_g1_i1:38-2458(+)
MSPSTSGVVQVQVLPLPLPQQRNLRVFASTLKRTAWPGTFDESAACGWGTSSSSSCRSSSVSSDGSISTNVRAGFSDSSSRSVLLHLPLASVAYALASVAVHGRRHRHAGIFTGRRASGHRTRLTEAPVKAGDGVVEGEEVNAEAVNVEDRPDGVVDLCFGVTDLNVLRFLEKKQILQPCFPDENLSSKYLAPIDGECRAQQMKAFLVQLEEGQVDFFVVPVKDLALELPEGLAMAAVLPREDAREAIVLRPGFGSQVSSLADLPERSSVWASSVRRRLQIAAVFPNLKIERSKTPWQTRLRHLHSNDVDAVIASLAALERRGLSAASREVTVLTAAELTPAFGQGALALLCHTEDEELLQVLAGLGHARTLTCIRWEQMLLQKLKADVSEAGFGPGAIQCGHVEVTPEEQLHISGKIVLPLRSSTRIIFAERSGPQQEAEALIMEASDEIRAALAAEAEVDDREDPETIGDLLMGGSESVQEPYPVSEHEDDVAEAEADGEISIATACGVASVLLKSIAGETERIPIEEVDCRGRTAYPGRICGVLPGGAGLLVDINCEVPAHWYPELIEGNAGTSSSSDTPISTFEDLGLGKEVEAYCCFRSHAHLRVVLEPPPRLALRGGFEPFEFGELRPGMGPLRAVVISRTAAGTLADFNCKIPGQLLADQKVSRGEELRVYCYKADATSETCVVGTKRQEKGVADEKRRSLEELSSAQGDVAYRGTVRRVTGKGVFVDFNCEVQGYIPSLDIDIDSWPSGLSTGHEVTVYIMVVDLMKSQVRLSMFRPVAGNALRVVSATGQSGGSTRN